MSKYFDPHEQRSNSSIYHNYMQRWEETPWTKRVIGQILTGLRTFITSLLCLLVLSSCDWQGREYYDVEVSDADYLEYYQQFRSRYLLWETSWGLRHDELVQEPRRNELRFVEFQSTDSTTCYFDPPNVIQIGHDKWESGCVPHEIGHAVLYHANHPCWGEFEHEDEKLKCQERF